MSTNEIVIVLLVGGVAATIKSITGMGYPLVLIPVLALFIGVAEAIVIVAPSNLVVNARLAWSVRHERQNAVTLNRFLAGGAVGGVLGASLLPSLPDNLLRGVLVGVIVLFLVNQFRSHNAVIGHGAAKRFATPVGGLAGLFQGAAGISGPIVTPWFLSIGIARDTYLFAIAAVFAVTGLAQLVGLVALGLFTGELLALGVALIPLAFLAFPLGVAIRNRISVETFHRVVLVLLALSALSLTVRMFS